MWAGLAVVAALGIALRAWIALHRDLSSDEAVVALMAEGILRGHLRAFYPGQHYGGIGAYPLAGLFALVGSAPWAVVAMPALLNLLAAAQLWRLGKAAGMEAAGAVGGALFWIFPFDYVWMGQFQGGFRWVVLNAGLAMLVATAKIASDPRRRLAWVVLGLACGLGWWGSPEITYFAGPALVVLSVVVLRNAVGDPRRIGGLLARILAAAAATAAGASVWIGAVSATGSALLPPQTGRFGYGEHLGVFFARVAPMVLGVETNLTHRWLFGPVPSSILAGVLGAAVISSALWWLRAPPSAAVGLAVVAFPFLYSIPSTSWYWEDGRYALYVAPLACLAIAHAAGAAGRVALRWLRAPAASAAISAAVLLAAGGAASTYTLWRIDRPLARANALPRASPNIDAFHYYSALASELRAAHVSHLYAGYWIAYPLDYYSHGTLSATPLRSVRFPSLYCKVATARNVGWVFGTPPLYLAPNQPWPEASEARVNLYLPGGLGVDSLGRWLASRHIPFRFVVLSRHFQLVVAQAPASPLSAEASAGHPLRCTAPRSR